MSEEQPQVRVHVTVPGPRAGVPYGLSIETINARDLSDDELKAEVTAHVKVYKESRRQVEDALAEEANKDYTAALTESVKQAKAAKEKP